ncbi:MAG TPA: F0F1 ATP synthase subunit gamma, partial [Kribbella sp.]|nr:F0F1 ATP synthase subunit gamma [Kribbella sp.]
ATFSNVDHPLTTEKPNPKRAAVLLITSDRGQAGAYSANVIREGERLNQMLREDEKEIVPYLSGRKGIAYYAFRQREVAQSWSGDSDNPSFARAREIADALIEAFLTPTEEGGVDEIHIVFTRFVSMLTQRADVIRLLPLEVVEGEEAPAADDVLPLYEFEPSAEEVLDGLLPKYVASRIHYCMLQAAASELANRQRAMKSATDNAQDLIEKLTRDLNQARQAQITQEISEIVGGASALADASAGSE